MPRYEASGQSFLEPFEVFIEIFIFCGLQLLLLII